MGIYTAPGVLAYVSNGSTLNTNLNLSPGTYDTVVEDWDYCGGAGTTPIKITVTNEGSSGVYVTSPSNNSNVGSPVNFKATFPWAQENTTPRWKSGTIVEEQARLTSQSRLEATASHFPIFNTVAAGASSARDRPTSSIAPLPLATTSRFP
jgi:hypothetical protein